MNSGQGQNNPHHGEKILATGKPLAEAQAAMILIHGRGATAESILMLANELSHPDFAYVAPQAAKNTWYPHSFLMPLERNEPWLSSALTTVGNAISHIHAFGIPHDRIVVAGFSQGACLASEYLARNPQRYGGLLVFSGGLIGPPGTPREYAGSLDQTPDFVGCSDVDFHIPVARVHETTETLRKMGAVVDERIYPQMDHTIIQDEIDAARTIIEGVLG